MSLMDIFVRGDSNNLPYLNNIMILEYMNNDDKHNIAEIRGVKALLSSRDSYVDTAVGYVEVKRNQTECIVRAKVVPEHKVSVKQYVVEVSLDEKNNTILQSSCGGCAAAAGGCKHSLVLLYWLEKRSNEPSTTSVECYWKKPKLSNVKQEPITSKEIFANAKKIELSAKDPQILEDLMKECRERNITNSLLTSFIKPLCSFNIFDMTIEFMLNSAQDHIQFNSYISYLNEKITVDVIKDIENKTKNQADSKLWHSIRQGRITASKIYEASRCSCDGSLVQQILGGYKVPETKQIQRGKKLEKKVLNVVEKLLKNKINNSGFFLINGVVGASPDGISEDFVVEVKCPASNKTFTTYIKEERVQDKYFAQCQIQMMASNKKKAVFCVADPNFEVNEKITIKWLNYNEDYSNNIMAESLKFWEKFIFNKVIKSAFIK